MNSYRESTPTNLLSLLLQRVHSSFVVQCSPDLLSRSDSFCNFVEFSLFITMPRRRRIADDIQVAFEDSVRDQVFNRPRLNEDRSSSTAPLYSALTHASRPISVPSAASRSSKHHQTLLQQNETIGRVQPSVQITQAAKSRRDCQSQ